VTVSCPDASLFEYAWPRSWPHSGRTREPVRKAHVVSDNSQMYLYLMNNMFDVNIRWDQQGRSDLNGRCAAIRAGGGRARPTSLAGMFSTAAGQSDHWQTQRRPAARVQFCPDRQAQYRVQHTQTCRGQWRGFIARFNETRAPRQLPPFLSRLWASSRPQRKPIWSKMIARSP